MLPELPEDLGTIEEIKVQLQGRQRSIADDKLRQLEGVAKRFKLRCEQTNAEDEAGHAGAVTVVSLMVTTQTRWKYDQGTKHCSFQDWYAGPAKRMRLNMEIILKED